MKKKAPDLTELPEIPCGTHPKVLLTGNGLTLSFDDAKGVDEIIIEAWKKYYLETLPKRRDPITHHAIWDHPLPLQVVIATKNHVDDCMTELSNHFKKGTSDSRQIELVKAILEADFDAVLTTNYSLEMEYSTIPETTSHRIFGYYRTTKEQTPQQAQFGLFQGTELPYANNPILWHIHGTALRKKSMVMGQYYYGKLLSEVVSRANAVVGEYKKSNAEGRAFKPKSWIDYFLIGNVYCFGISLDLSESGIWWLLSLKKSAFSESKFYFYEREPGSGIKKLLLDAYGVETPATNSIKGNDYIEFYKNVSKII